MNPNKHYIKKHESGKVIAIVMTAILLIILAIGVLDLYGVFDKNEYEPDIIVPMTNTHVGWEQTYHFGWWGDQV